MKTLSKLALALLVATAPSLVFGQKPAKVHTPPVHVVKSHTVVPKTPKNDVAEDAAKRADKIADKTAKTEEKTEHIALKTALAEHGLDKGLKLTATERRQWETIEKNYDKQFRDLRKTENTADRTARKTNTVDNDATFNAQLSSLELNERNALRATLTPQQQSIFDANVANLSKPKH
jgi:hypothetical protein